MGATVEAKEAVGTYPCMDNTMNRRLTLALIATTLSLLSAGAFAQYTGPGATHAVTTVAEARDQRDDQPVVLRGTLVARIGHERYRFKDATGEIDVEIDDKDLPSHRPSARPPWWSCTVRWIRTASSRPTSTWSTSPWCPCVEGRSRFLRVASSHARLMRARCASSDSRVSLDATNATQ